MKLATFTRSDLAARALDRPPGYVDEVMRLIVKQDANTVTLDVSSAEYKALKRRYGAHPTSRRAKPIRVQRVKPDTRTISASGAAPSTTPTKRPLPLDPVKQALVDRRKSVCRACPNFKGEHQVTVRCRLCGCAGKSLLHGSCPDGRW